MKKQIMILLMSIIGFAYGAIKIGPISGDPASVIRTKLNTGFANIYSARLLAESNTIAIVELQSNTVAAAATVQATPATIAIVYVDALANQAAIVAIDTNYPSGTITIADTETMFLRSNTVNSVELSITALNAQIANIVEPDPTGAGSSENATMKAYVDLMFLYLPQASDFVAGSYTNQASSL